MNGSGRPALPWRGWRLILYADSWSLENDECRRKFPDEVGTKEKRRLKAGREPEIGAWYGLGLFGVVGWAVAIPTLLGILLGVWIDLTWPSPRSWTLMLLVGGLGLGCLKRLAVGWGGNGRRLSRSGTVDILVMISGGFIWGGILSLLAFWRLVWLSLSFMPRVWRAPPCGFMGGC